MISSGACSDVFRAAIALLSRSRECPIPPLSLSSRTSGAYELPTESRHNWPEYHRELAVEQWVGHNDGYALNTNNYRPYFNPEDGLMQVLPWDLDYGFLNDSDWGMSWASPRGQLA